MVLHMGGNLLKPGCRVEVHLEDQDEPVIGTVLEDQRDYLSLRELDTPISRSRIVTCTVISGDGGYEMPEADPVDTVRPFAVHESPGIRPVAEGESEESAARSPVLRKTLLLLAVFLAALAVGGLILLLV